MTINLPHPAEHGAFVPGQGYYDKTLRGWVSKQERLTVLAEDTPIYSDNVADFEAWGKRSEFKANPELDRLIELRDSDRPEQRAKAEQIITGTMRMQLGTYENAKAAHTEAGAEA